MLLALAAVGLVATGGSWTGNAGPQLVRVLDVAPRQVELGDRVAILGEGFPAGRPARVTFEGTLHRPGERAVRDAQIVLTGAVTAPGQVQLVFGDATQALFCGAGDRATHTTFEGTVQVAFAAAMQGAPPVAGALAHVTFDVRPTERASDGARDREGTRLLGWIGVRATAGAAGLVVEAVDPGSRAQAAGLVAGDVLASFDGVRVATAGDLVPAPGEREAAVGVRRGGAASETPRTVSVEGFRRAPPEELLGAALVILAALAVVVLFGAPSRLMLSARLQRAVARVRARLASARLGAGAGGSPASATSAGSAPPARRVPAGSGSASPLGRLGRALAAAAGDALPPAGVPAVVDAVACGLLASMPFGQYLIAARLDVALLFAAAVTVLAVAAFVASGSAWRGVRAAAQVAWQHVPAAAAVATVVVTTGSLRVQEIGRVQGGWPWDWLAFRSPATLVALALLLACAGLDVDIGAPGASGVASLLEAPAPAAAPREPWLAAACRAHRIVIAGLASALFLGGWLLPGLSPAEQDARPWLELAGAAWLLAKTWGLIVAVAWARWALPRRRMVERTRATAVWLAPLAVAALAATAAWTWWSPARAEQLLVSASLVAAVALGAVAFAVRVRHGLVAAGGDARVSPFL
jgi:NADH-quinone oxidoreductase subunit H